MPWLVTLTIVTGLVEGKLTRTVIFTEFNHHPICIVILAEKQKRTQDSLKKTLRKKIQFNHQYPTQVVHLKLNYEIYVQLLKFTCLQNNF